MGSSIEITRAEAIHISDIIRIENETFPCPWPEEAFLEEIHFPFSHFLIAQTVTGNKNRIPVVVGYIIFWSVADEMQILNIATSKNSRRCGIGQKLLDVAIKTALEKKVRIISLEVRKSNLPAINFYKKNGFGIVGIRRGYYSNNNEDALVMVLVSNCNNNQLY
ncbi:MAG: ribosomal-protein-alanine N-acetyltransferase [Candidatus Schekmanbacteria bacterium RBG_13_48_7]|uniref:Ribosomal-protein-alanine N-acetyltransferase n=1 Tax=Candidatus Schekmanbacteria bacterium RBG_13_48_7 TaxID=1817878 RepID=A0A1F7S2W7_9BACT|nr:MAG: ribosomal-protein-alanine N-acetyltransferase [Candidatus Schekmanbacteria bacterium RBG_13_48_7]